MHTDVVWNLITINLFHSIEAISEYQATLALERAEICWSSATDSIRALMVEYVDPDSFDH